MDLYKIVHFNQVSGGVPFPWFYSLGEDESRQVRAKLGSRSGTQDPLPDDAEIYRTLAPRFERLKDVNANDADFRLSEVLHAFGVTPGDFVSLDWADDQDRFNASIDRMKFGDFDKYFGLIWYPELDDLLLFDDSFSWACEIDLVGAINLIKF